MPAFIHSPALARGLCVGRSVQKLLHTPMFAGTVLVSEHRLKSFKLKVWTSGAHIQQNPNRQRFRLKPQTRNILLNVADQNKQKHGCSYESVYLKQTCFHVLHMKCDGLWVPLVSSALTDMEQHLFSNWKQRKPSGTCWAWTFSNEPCSYSTAPTDVDQNYNSLRRRQPLYLKSSWFLFCYFMPIIIHSGPKCFFKLFV